MLRLASLALSGAGVALLALGRGHYTIDILVAYWVSSWLWRVYHAVAHLPSLRQQSHNPLAGLACWHVIRLGSPCRSVDQSLVCRYLEANVPAQPLPRKYSLPLASKFIQLFRKARRESSSIQQN